MKIDHRVKYLTYIIIPSVLMVIVGSTSLCHQISEKVAVVSFGVPLYSYLVLARTFHAGEVFNIFLLFIVSAGYLAILFLPLLYLFRFFKWSLVVWQAGLLAGHVLIGLVMIVAYS